MQAHGIPSQSQLIEDGMFSLVRRFNEENDRVAFIGIHRSDLAAHNHKTEIVNKLRTMEQRIVAMFVRKEELNIVEAQLRAMHYELDELADALDQLQYHGQGIERWLSAPMHPPTSEGELSNSNSASNNAHQSDLSHANSASTNARSASPTPVPDTPSTPPRNGRKARKTGAKGKGKGKGKGTHRCASCAKSFKTANGLVSHELQSRRCTRNWTPPTFKCPGCAKTYTSFNGVRQHSLHATHPKCAGHTQLACKKCGKAYSSILGFGLHDKVCRAGMAMRELRGVRMEGIHADQAKRVDIVDLTGDDDDEVPHLAVRGAQCRQARLRSRLRRRQR